MLNWATLDMVETYIPYGYRLVVTTDVPCHLWMKWTLQPPDKHPKTYVKRGLKTMWGLRYCFVATTDNEQAEAGDTLTHTFTKLNWPWCQTRWFYFYGSVGGLASPSTSPIFKLHRVRPSLPIDIRIASSSDDAHYHNTTFYLTADKLECGHVVAHDYAPGFRFIEIPLDPVLPPTIATINFRSWQMGRPVQINLRGQRSTDTETFSTFPDFMARPRTIYVNRLWILSKAPGDWYSLDVLPIITEIISQFGWEAGNSLVIFFDFDLYNAWVHEYYSFDLDPASAAYLHLE